MAPDATLWSYIQEGTVAAPVTEIFAMLLALSMCLLFRLNRLGLILAYVFTFHMGWLFCQRGLLVDMPSLRPYSGLYFLFGGAILFLTIIGMTRSDH